MKTYKINLYSFDELSEDVKIKLCDKERESTYNYGTMAMESDAEERISTLNKFCELFNITYRIDYDHQYRFISWQFVDVDMNGYDWNADDIKGKYLLRYLNRFYYGMMSKKYFSTKGYWDENRKFHYKYRHSQFQYTKGNCPFTGVCYDEDILAMINSWYQNPDWGVSLKGLFEDVFNYYMAQWEKEDDYRMSDEYIMEMLSANNEDTLYFANGAEFEGSESELEEYNTLSDAE